MKLTNPSSAEPKDFYQSKGTKLGIKALFKMFFAENDVDVTYPGDRMIIPSRSGYVERQILRTIPVSKYFYPPLQETLYQVAQSVQNLFQVIFDWRC